MTGGNRPMKRRHNSQWLWVLAILAGGVMAQDQPVVEYHPADDTERKPLHTVVPVYPEKARRARVEGEVEVCFEVDREGKTRKIAVRRSTNQVFERPARDAVRASTYRPLKDDEKLSGIKTCRTFRFTLEPVEPDDSQS